MFLGTKLRRYQSNNRFDERSCREFCAALKCICMTLTFKRHRTDTRRRRRHHIVPIVKYARCRCAFPPFLSLAHSRFSLQCRTPTRYHQFTVFDSTRYFQVSFPMKYYIFLKMKKVWQNIGPPTRPLALHMSLSPAAVPRHPQRCSPTR